MPSVCLSVDDLQMAHCCMPSALSHSGQNQSPSIGTEGGEKNMKGASELYWTKWSMLSGLTVYEQEKGREKGVRESPLYLFFFSPSSFSTVKCICLQPLCRAHKAVWRLKTCFLYVRFSRCDTQGNCYFLPPTVVYGKQVSKTPSVSKVNLIKVAKWKVHALIFRSLGCVWEFEICSCDSGSQLFFSLFLFTLKCECAKCMQLSTQKSRWISQLNRTIIKLYQHTELWGVQPNYYSFEKHWCYSGLIQNGGRRQEYICFLNSECTMHNACRRKLCEVCRTTFSRPFSCDIELMTLTYSKCS